MNEEGWVWFDLRRRRSHAAYGRERKDHDSNDALTHPSVARIRQAGSRRHRLGVRDQAAPAGGDDIS